MSETTFPAFHVMAKPTGSRCNLRCDYCFFLEKSALYPGSDERMTDEVMEAFVRQTIAAQEVPFVTLAWQGGEPTLMGLDFFKRALEVEKDALPSDWQVERTLQTNGTLLTDEWAAFLAENNVLVGLSIDGPRELHDAYRHDGAGRSVFDQVEAAALLLRRHGAEFNVLCTINAANADHPLDVYRYFRDELGARFIQFIPIVEVETPPTDGVAGTVTDRSVGSLAFGKFLSAIFDEWVRHDVGGDVRAALRRRARVLPARILLAVHTAADLRRRGRAGAQRRRVLVRPLRGHAVPARQHHGDADR